MADPVIKKRPVVLRLAELRKYPTLDHRYAATLPFRAGPAKCDCCWDLEMSQFWCNKTPPDVKAKCIKRTAERWAWFSSARDLDDTYGERLGTLNYLPWEIRQIIIEMLFVGPSSYRGIFVARALADTGVLYPFTTWRLDEYIHYGLWLASPSTRTEMEHYYLSNIRFVFYDPEELIIFTNRLSTYQWSLVRLVTLEVFWESSSSLNDWMSACARLPPNLISIEIGMSKWHLVGAETHKQWFLARECPYWTADPAVYRASILMNTLAKLAHRVAAKAKIGMVASGLKYEDEREITPHRVLGDLEPWSKDYLDWWEEETKIDFDGDEKFNKAAWNPYLQHPQQDKPWKIES